MERKYLQTGLARPFSIFNNLLQFKCDIQSISESTRKRVSRLSTIFIFAYNFPIVFFLDYLNKWQNIVMIMVV